MTDDSQSPPWNPNDKPASLVAFAQWLHDQAKGMFLTDRTHAHILFLFGDEGLVSMNPIPPNTDEEQIVAGVRQAVQEQGLYGVISIAEAWTYFSQGTKDHTAVQLLHNEMRVSDLKDEHKTEALMVRMESRDRDYLAWIDPIIRDGNEVDLGPGMMLPKEKCLRLWSYFGQHGILP